MIAKEIGKPLPHCIPTIHTKSDSLSMFD